MRSLGCLLGLLLLAQLCNAKLHFPGATQPSTADGTHLSRRRLLHRGRGQGNWGEDDGGEDPLWDPSWGPNPFDGWGDPTDPPALQDGQSPACHLVTDNSEPTLVAPECPAGLDPYLDADQGLYTCLANCTSLDNRRLGLRYRGARHGKICLPACSSNETETGSTDNTITCSSCPAGYEYMPSKSLCYKQCTDADGLPIPITDPSAPPRCAAQCPRGFKSRSSTTCAAVSGSATATRRWAPRKSTAPRKNVKRGVARRERPHASCPNTATELADANGNTQCYECPDGTTLTQDAAGAAICAAETCGDGYSLASDSTGMGYCWHDSLGTADAATQTALLDIVGLALPDCTSAETSPPPEDTTTGTTDPNGGTSNPDNGTTGSTDINA
ncbi:hypothetical protein ABPG75_005012 [Micractinium tetrahymenae]